MRHPPGSVITGGELTVYVLEPSKEQNLPECHPPHSFGLEDGQVVAYRRDDGTWVSATSPPEPNEPPLKFRVRINPEYCHCPLCLVN
jgi:hypothetical protein